MQGVRNIFVRSLANIRRERERERHLVLLVLKRCSPESHYSRRVVAEG